MIVSLVNISHCSIHLYNIIFVIILIRLLIPVRISAVMMSISCTALTFVNGENAFWMAFIIAFFFGKYIYLITVSFRDY